MDKNSVKTLCDLIAKSAECYGDKTYLKEKRGNDIIEKTFNQLYHDCMCMNSFISSRAEGKTVHAAVLGATCYTYLVSYFGTVFGGNTIVPLDAQLSPADMCELINRADVEIFFYHPRLEAALPQIKEMCPKIHTFVSLGESESYFSVEKITEEYAPAAPKEVSPETMAAILYTSGTTGKSKGVMLSHANLIDNTMCCDNESTPEDVTLTVLPIHHVYCFTCDILLSLRYGSTICVNDSILRIAQNLKLFQPTIMLLVPMIAETIYKQIKAASAAKPEIPMAAIAKAVFGGRLKGIYSGGAYLSPDLANAYRSMGIPMSQGYGMTECSPRISCSLFTEENVGDVGKIVNGCEVKIVDGEIWAKSPSVMMGYYKDPVSTAETLTEDGWLRTGDLGYVDEQNRVFITGRKKNLIILSNGENVSPEELENKFTDIDMVAEVLVYSEDSVITAEIFPNPEVCKDMDKAEIARLLNEHIKKINSSLPSAKTIRRLRVRDVEFDKTTSKKIKRQQTSKGELV